MIKLILFDLDGVLIESKIWHFETLNCALEKIDRKYVISEKEHIEKYDGLSTRTKLMKLTNEKGLPLSLHDQIWKDKQFFTQLLIEEKVQPNRRLIEMMI